MATLVCDSSENDTPKVELMDSASFVYLTNYLVYLVNT